MGTKFKEGDLVYKVIERSKVKLDTLFRANPYINLCSEDDTTYLDDGRQGEWDGIPSIFHATPENRQALVTLYGEDAVPKLPLSPQEITLKLLENQKYQLCRVSNHSTNWKHNKNLKAIVHIGVFGEFLDSNGEGWTYGIPVDNNGNEITEIE